MGSFDDGLGSGIESHQTRGSSCNNILDTEPSWDVHFPYLGTHIG